MQKGEGVGGAGWVKSEKEMVRINRPGKDIRIKLFSILLRTQHFDFTIFTHKAFCLSVHKGLFSSSFVLLLHLHFSLEFITLL